MDGAKGAALPLIRHDLGLSYDQVGLLASVPLLVGGFLELPLGVLAGDGRRRRLAILGGGVLFVLTLLAAASARSFSVLLAAFIAFYPASGAFVSLTQAEIMDARPDRRAQVMARWELAGATGEASGAPPRTRPVPNASPRSAPVLRWGRSTVPRTGQPRPGSARPLDPPRL